ncbi:MAG: transporter substrate-binding domain-containing protein [Phycisphaerae bacterium]|nr:transporter substrate-binding domain-containing protein [Phycisphaerae bacterium]
MNKLQRNKKHDYAVQAYTIFPLRVLLIYWSFIVISIISPSSVFGQQSQNNDSSSNKVYKAGIPNVPPIMYMDKDGKIVGFSAEVLEAAAEDENIQLQWVNGSWAELFDMLIAGQIDILPGMQITATRQESLDFLENDLYMMWSELYIPDDIDLNAIRDLNGKKIGLVINDNNADGFIKYIDRFKLKYEPVYFKSHKLAIQAGRRNEVFAIVGPMVTGNDDFWAGFKSSGLYFNPTNVGIAVPKGKNNELVNKLDIRLALYKADQNSIYHSLYQEYGMDGPADHNIVPQWVMYAFLVSILIGIIAWTFVFALRIQVNKKTYQLKQYSETLEQKVKKRTEQLDKQNKYLKKTFQELKAAQTRLILSEKMAVLGNLIAGIAHEINSPLGAIGACNSVVNHHMNDVVECIDDLSRWFCADNGPLLRMMLSESIIKQIDKNVPSYKLIRQSRIEIAQQLENADITNCYEIASFIIDLKLQDSWQQYIGLLKSPDACEMMTGIVNIANIFGCCNTIEIAVGKASRIIQALKKYVHIDYSQMESPQKKPICVRDGIETVLILFQNRIKNDIDLEIYFGDIPVVSAIEDELNQVWTNLIQNAIQAMDNSGALIINVYEKDKGVIVEIIDNGHGIDADILPRIFEPLFTTKAPGLGIGLGMDIVKKILDNHNGTINVQSQSGKGTTVTVWLPVSTETDMSA